MNLRIERLGVFFSTEALRSTLTPMTLLYTCGLENVINLDLLKKPKTLFNIIRSFLFNKRCEKVWENLECCIKKWCDHILSCCFF